MKERARSSFFYIRSLYKKDGTIKDPAEWDADIGAAVSSLKVKEIEAEGSGESSSSRILEVRLHSKDSSLQALEKFRGFMRRTMDRGIDHSKT